MFSKSIYTRLERLVGYNESISDIPNALTDFLTESESGMYFTDFSPFARVDYLQDVCPNFVQAVTTQYFALPVWNNTATYNAGDTVRNDLGAWKALAANTNAQPTFESAFWKFLRFEPSLNGYLAETRRKAVKIMLQKLFEDKVTRRLTKTLIQEQFLFQGIGNPNQTEPNLQRFVGVEIALQQLEGVKVVISQIGLQLTQPQTLNLYLYHRSQDTPLRIIPATINVGYRFAWTNLDEPIELYAREFNLSPGESYILGYYEEDLLGAAVNKMFAGDTGCFFSKPCMTCGGRYERLFWELYTPYVSFRPITIASNFLNASRNLPLLGEADENLQRHFNRTYGLNFALSVRCELDSFIERNRDILAQLLGLQTITLLMQEAEMNLRMNRIQTVTYDYILREKEAKASGMPSVWSDLEQAYKAVSFDFSNFKSPCLPCESRVGVQTVTI